MSFDSLLNRRYNSNTYNCAHFVVEAWHVLTGQDISAKFVGMLEPEHERKIKPDLVKSFKRLQKPEHLSIVLFQQPINSPHVGIFYNKKVLHIQKDGVKWQPLEIAKLGFTSVRFYK